MEIRHFKLQKLHRQHHHFHLRHHTLHHIQSRIHIMMLVHFSHLINGLKISSITSQLTYPYFVGMGLQLLTIILPLVAVTATIYKVLTIIIGFSIELVVISSFIILVLA